MNNASGRHSEELLARVRTGLQKKLQGTVLMGRLRAEIIQDVATTAGRRQRRETLDLDNEQDLARWQILHNDPEHYEIIDERDSHTARSSLCHVVYWEIGDDLPIAKSVADLRAQDDDRND
jgi:hypothetical protein